MAKKNLCGVEIEYAEDKEFHDGMFHCYGPHTVDGAKVENDNQNFVTIESANGVCINVIAMCPHLEDAKSIVCAMGIAKKLMDAKVGSIKDILNGMRPDLDKRLRDEGYDLEMMENKMKELMNEGKTPKEISEYMLSHRSDFLVKKPDSKPTDDGKERW